MPTSCPCASALSVAVDPASFADEAEALGLVISERSARRILDGEIAPVDPLINRVRIEGEADGQAGPAAGEPSASKTRGVSESPAKTWTVRATRSMRVLGRRDYYLGPAVKPRCAWARMASASASP